MSKRKAPNATSSSDKSDDVNAKIADFLYELSNYEKNVTRQTHKANAYRKAASTISGHDEVITSGSQAMKLPGVGKQICKKIDEFLATGKLQKLEKIRADDSNTLINDLTRVNGIGPAKAADLVKKGVKSVEDLQKKEFNDELTKAQRIGVNHFEDFEKRIPRSEIVEIEDLIMKDLKSLSVKYKATICGSYRRGADTSGDIDILLTHEDYKTGDANGNEDKKGGKKKGAGLLKAVVEKLEERGLVTDVLSLGEAKFMGVCKLDEEKPFRRLDILILPKEQFYCGVLYFTGSDMFNKAMRTRALEMGFTLNEHSLRPLDAGHVPLEPLPVSSEEDIFDYISYDFKEPVDRNV